MIDFVGLIPVFPATGAVVNGLIGSRIGKRAVGLIGCTTVAFSFLVALSIFFELLSFPPKERSIEVALFNWFASGRMRIDVTFLIDPLSCLMALVVSGVGLLIHIYSIGYMHADRAYWRYFSFLNLFIFFMLMLVLAGNYLLLFLGWEGVGLCSYLLIGFWYEKKSASDAGKKAFVVNRIGDFGFLIGLFLLFRSMEGQGISSLRFKDVFENLHLLDPATLTAISLLLFAGAVGKSAQFPLHVWLPDAMEGPTPVSALIHAATMVTAGVYMVARNNVLFALAPVTGEVVAASGMFTALFAATIALTQYDIKRVLAYSTISQLGYMFAAVGVGAYAAGIFHLMTHAFFKGLLFLGAGSVMHAMSGDQDMRNMGGLHRLLKFTSLTFITGAVAIAGIPPLSGFWSKDAILFETFRNGNHVIWAVGVLTAALTAFYMFRQVFLVFSGTCRADPRTRQHIHESPRVMTLPLLLLAVLAVMGGAVGVPFFEKGSPLQTYLGPVFEQSLRYLNPVHVEGTGAAEHGGLELALMGVSTTAGLLGILLAALMYFEPFKSHAPSVMNPEVLAGKFKGLYSLLHHKYYIDETYDTWIVNPLRRFCRHCLSFDLGVIDELVNGAGWMTRLAAWISHKADIYLVDGIFNSMATLVGFNSGFWRRLQTGYLQNYALIFAMGLLFVIGGLLFVPWTD
jgi:NADH-quinone oxidoreductase subunit L